MNRSEAGKLGYEKTKLILEQKYKNRIEEYNSNPNQCIVCNNTLEYSKKNNKFCSHSCSAIHSNQLKTSKYRYCAYCNKQLKTSSKKYCSSNCMYLFITEEKIKENTATSVVIRNYLLRTKRFCNNCKLSEWMNKPINLELHHVDGNYQNNSIENIVLLCPNCHSMTDTFKAKNKGRGRTYRALKITAPLV